MKQPRTSHTKERGAVVEMLVIGIVLIGVVAAVAWRYIEADKAQNDADRAINGLSQAVISERLTRMQIPELGISVRYDNTHGPLSYRVNKGDSGLASVTLRNETFKVSSPGCESYNATYQDIAVIDAYSLKPSTPTESIPALEANGKYYYLYPMKAAVTEGGECSDATLLKKRSVLFPSIFLQG